MSRPPVTKQDITRRLVNIADKVFERWEDSSRYDDDTNGLLGFAISALDSAYAGAAVFDPEIQQIADSLDPKPVIEEES